MQNVNPKKLRAELKDYLDLASGEPIRIQRRSGESYVLINEDNFSEMKNEIMSLQKRLLAMTEVVDKKAQEYQVGDRTRLKRLKKKEQMVKFYFTQSYSKELERIEDFILESTESIEQVEKFLD